MNLKSIALDFEKNNQQFLQFVDSTKGYKRIYDHSAIIFKHDIAPSIGYKTANLQPDILSTKTKATYGSISFKNFDNLAEKLQKIGIKEYKKKNMPGLIYYKLPKKYSQNEIEEIAKKLTEEKNQISKIISVKNPNPTLFFHLLTLEKTIYENSKKFHEIARTTIGQKIVNLSCECLDSYLLHANSNQNNSKLLQKIQINLLMLRYKMKTIENLNLIETKNLRRILDEIVILEQITNKEIQKILTANSQK